MGARDDKGGTAGWEAMMSLVKLQQADIHRTDLDVALVPEVEVGGERP
jgi:hypothetical protein